MTATAASPRHVGERWGGRSRRSLVQLRDRARVSDPGLGRLRTALSAVVCVGTALPVQLAVSSALGYPGQVGFAATMFGAVVAMLGSNALVGAGGWARVRTAAFFPVAVALGLLPATLTDGEQLLQVVGFAVMLFLAVWVRRFGPNFFSYGFMAWMGFFFATFLHATFALVPELLIASVVSTVWVLLITSTLLRTRPRSVLRSTLLAFFSAGRSVARECADLLEVRHPDGTRWARAQRAVSGREAAMAEASLLAEAWSSEPGATPEGWSPSALRRRLLETQQAVERFSGAAQHLSRRGTNDEIRSETRRVLDHLAARRDRAAAAAAERLVRAADADHARQGDDWWPARHVAYGVQEFLRFDARAAEPPEVDPGEEDFESATGLILGGLAGSPAVARDVAVRGGRFNPLTRVSMTTRQATQVAVAGLLAIALGFALSPTRYYWAVIAAFVTFTGTGTRSETLRKGGARIGGTLLGIVAAILLAHVTLGHTALIFTVILVSIFLAFYLIKVSYAAMTFFVTVLLGQLYTVIGTFSDSLLALRLEETAVGAVAGVVVALLLAPLSTRDTVRSARDRVYESMAGMLDGAADFAEGERRDLDALTRAMDTDARGLALVARPLLRPLLLGTSNGRTRRRLALVVAAVSQCRALALALQRRTPDQVVDGGAAVATAARSLALGLRTMRQGEFGRGVPEAADALGRADRALFERRDSADPDRDSNPVVRHLHHLAGTLTQLAETEAAYAGPSRSGPDVGPVIG